MKRFFSQSLASLLIAGFIVPFLSVGVAFAAKPTATLDAVITEGNPCLGTALSLSGNGTVSPANAGQLDQYAIEVIWGPGAISEEGIPLVVSGASSPFSYTFTAGPHIYTTTPPANITVQIYHQSPNGNDNQVDATFVVPTCPPNEPPVISGVPATVTIPELDAYSFDADATDPEDNTLTWSLVGAPTGASINATTGEFSWTPTESQGPNVYTFKVRVSDGQNNVDADIEITVTEVNTAPSATSASVSTAMNTDKDITLGGSDTDIPANSLTYEIVSGPSNGTLSVVSGNQVTYTPDADYVGSDDFTFKVIDDGEPVLESDPATITITISNDAPSMDVIDDQMVDEETNLSVSVFATDPNEADVLEYTLGANTLPVGHTATVDLSTGEFNWTPTESDDSVVPYSVTINVTDGAATDSQTFAITVNEVNQAPGADDGVLSVDEDSAADVTLTGSDMDIPTQTLTFTIASQPSNGVVNLVDDVATYIPNANFNGSDSFTFTTNDGETDSSPATVMITVNPVNDAPTIDLIGEPSITVSPNSEYNDQGATCSDIDGDESELSIDDGGFDSSLAGTTFTFTYTCDDGNGGEASTTRSVTVSQIPVNNPPALTAPDDFAPINVTTGSTFTDPATAANDIEDGDLTPGVVVTGTVDTNTPGTYVLTYTVTDSGGLTTTKTRTVTVVTPVTPNGGGGNSSGSIPNGGSGRTGQVLGESTLCGITIDQYMRKGYSNKPEGVKKLQELLAQNLGITLKADGVFGNATENAVKQFQAKYADQILKPWGLTQPTGLFYVTSQITMNNLMCPDLKLPIPAVLIPWSKNPAIAKS